MPIYTARHVLPIATPALKDGAVAIRDNMIAAVGFRNEIVEEFPDEPVRDLGDAVLLPGLVNAHCHTELSWMADDRPPGGDFLSWLRGFVARRDAEDEAVARKAAAAALDTMAARGTVALGDICNRTWMAELLGPSALWGVAFHEVFGLLTADAVGDVSKAAERVTAMQATLAGAGGRWSVSLSPHAPHTTSATLLRALAGRAETGKEPMSIHVAESAVEIDFLAGTDGHQFQAYLEQRGMWDPQWTAPEQSPIDYLDRHRVLGPRTLAVHCVHVAQHEIPRMQSRGVTVVTCPRSNDFLGVGVAPVMKLLGAGIPVALGTDSLATTPDLDMFAELAALVGAHRGLAPAAAVRMATLNGAVALGLGDRLGSIEPDKHAELIVVPLAETGDDPFETLVGVPGQVWRLDAAPCAEA